MPVILLGDRDPEGKWVQTGVQDPETGKWLQTNLKTNKTESNQVEFNQAVARTNKTKSNQIESNQTVAKTNKIATAARVNWRKRCEFLEAMYLQRERQNQADFDQLWMAREEEVARSQQEMEEEVAGSQQEMKEGFLQIIMEKSKEIDSLNSELESVCQDLVLNQADLQIQEQLKAEIKEKSEENGRLTNELRAAQSEAGNIRVKYDKLKEEVGGEERPGPAGEKNSLRGKAKQKVNAPGKRKARQVCDLECKSCEKVYPTKRKLRRHVRKFHTKSRDFICGWPGCGKDFLWPYYLDRHQKMHTREKQAKLYDCVECKQTFSQKANLKKHMKVHAGGK